MQPKRVWKKVVLRETCLSLLHIANLLDVEVSPKDVAELLVSCQEVQH